MGNDRTDRWRFAARAAGMLASDVRALFAMANRDDVVSLAGGMPNVAALPLPTMAELVADLLTERGAQALQYGSAQGEPGLRERICDVMAIEGIAADPADVVVTVGSQQALDLLARVFLDPGDVVLVEAPTYLTAIGTFTSYQARIVHVATDEHGLIPAALAETLARPGPAPKLLYTVPMFGNPAGVTLDPARRAEVVELCRRAGVLVVEDNPYGLLDFDGVATRALRADAPHDVVYLGSFSKTLAPGLRVGWALAPPAVRDKLIRAAEVAMLSHSVFAQLAVERYLATQPWPRQLAVFRRTYRQRCETMLDALATHMPPGVTWTRPRGGFFVWLRLPPTVDTSAVLPRALAAGVAYVPGRGFHADGGGRDALRLAFCYPPADRIRDGVARLGAVLRTELDGDATDPRRAGVPALAALPT